MQYKNQLPYSTPESQGISSNSIRNFVHRVDTQIESFHSFMLLRHGRVVAEGWWHPYKEEMPHMLFSLSKSYTSTAIGMAVDEGLLNVDDPVLKFFPDDAPSHPSDNLKALRVRHLLCMSTGHAVDTTVSLHNAADGNWPRAFLSLPVDNPPGAPFVYNTGATYMLSVILQNVTGLTLLDYLRPRLFDPLGIENPVWETCPRGYNTGGFGLSVTTPDIAKFGQLFLQRGMWQGKQLISNHWIETATSSQAANDVMSTPDWKQGYGYQFWRCQHNGYRGDGAFGQYCIVMPDQDAVLAITSGVKDMQAVLDTVWQNILPSMKPNSLPENPQAYAALLDKCSHLSLPLIKGSSQSPHAQSISGKTFALPANDLDIESIGYEFACDNATVTIKDQNGANPIKLSYDAWHTQPGRDARGVSQPVAANGVWVADDIFVTKCVMCHTPFITKLTTKFEGNQIQANIEMNVGFNPTQAPTLTGKLVE